MSSPRPNNRVLVIALHFPPCRVIGAQSCAQIARYLPAYGWSPVVLTVREDHFEDADPNDRRAFPGEIIRTRVLPHPIAIYRKLKGVGPHSVRPQLPPESGRALRAPTRLRQWILSLLHTPDIDTGWIVPAVIAGLIAIRRHRITRIFSSAPMWTNHLVGLVLATLTRLPWTVHLRDPWTQVEREKPVSGISRRLERWLERMVMKRADVVVSVTEPHTRLLREIFSDLPAEKFVTIPNGYDDSEWTGLGSPPAEREKFVITYTGSLYDNRNPRPIFAAVRELIDSRAVDARDLRIDLFGACETAQGVPVPQIAAEVGVSDCVHIGGQLSRPATLRTLASSDLLLLLGEGLDLQIPGKTYEYLRAGPPILALTTGGALADLLRRTGGAWVVDPSDVDGIAAAIREAYASWKRGEPRRAADPVVVGRFDRKVLSGELARLLETA